MIDVNSLKSCRPFEVSVVEEFMEEPEFADYLLNEVMQDGDDEEITYFQSLYDEARARSGFVLPQVAMA